MGTNKKGMLGLVACLAVLCVAGPAVAAPPLITGAGTQDFYPTASFQAFGADYGVVQIATTPDRATDGDFLSPNQEVFSILTDGEMESGYWKYGYQIKPGAYYMLMRTSLGPSEFSSVVPFTVATPSIKWRGSGKIVKFLSKSLTLRLSATPLGDDRNYKVCFKRRGKKKCLKDQVDGYTWFKGSAYDEIDDISLRGLTKRTKFTWYVDNKRVASKTIKVR